MRQYYAIATRAELQTAVAESWLTGQSQITPRIHEQHARLETIRRELSRPCCDDRPALLAELQHIEASLETLWDARRREMAGPKRPRRDWEW